MRHWVRCYSLTRPVPSLQIFQESCQDHELIYKHRSSGELLRWHFLLGICGQKIFARNAFQIFQGAHTVLGPSLFSTLFKPLVYNLFIAGNDRKSILRSMNKMAQVGLVPFLSPMLEDSPNSVQEDQKQVQNVVTIKDCISMCSELSTQTPLPINALAIKLTAFIGTPILEELAKKCSQPFDTRLVKKMSAANSGHENSFALEQRHYERYLEGIANLMAICRKSMENNVVVFIDAEYSHLQASVRLITLALMMEFNQRDKICIANTYQCYLRDCSSHLAEDLSLASEMGFSLGIKLVRGAYMDLERSRSLAKGITDPIWADYNGTNQAYDIAVGKLLRLYQMDPDCGHLTVLATHNLESIKMAISRTDSMPKASLVNLYFGQINGMADQISLALAHSGHKCLKLIPCGSVDEVLPWLARRVQENSVALHRVSWDRQLIRKELVRRFKRMMRRDDS